MLTGYDYEDFNSGIEYIISFYEEHPQIINYKNCGCFSLLQQKQTLRQIKLIFNEISSNIKIKC